MNSGSLAAAQDHMRTILTLVGRGAEEYDRWNELRHLQGHKVKLIESERKHLYDTQQMITVERMMLAVSRLIDIVHRHIHDVPTLRSISADIDREVLQGPAGRA